MKTRIAVLADYASLSIDHKLNIMGIFTTINAPQVPVVHPQMKLVTQFEFDASEAGQRPMRVTLVDDDGHELFGIGGTVTIQATHDGHPALLNQIVDLSQLAFPAFGDYEFRIYLDDEVAAEIPLLVAQAKQPPGQQPEA
ncbi:MAG: hypothetical protein KDE45_18125 [Caldilineaceae bacterium]|nr:hypothetical protein [Caldilineaceae bacterium]